VRTQISDSKYHVRHAYLYLLAINNVFSSLYVAISFIFANSARSGSVPSKRRASGGVKRELSSAGGTKDLPRAGAYDTPKHANGTKIGKVNRIQTDILQHSRATKNVTYPGATALRRPPPAVAIPPPLPLPVPVPTLPFRCNFPLPMLLMLLLLPLALVPGVLLPCGVVGPLPSDNFSPPPPCLLPLGCCC
jgi:hypothetical protein